MSRISLLHELRAVFLENMLDYGVCIARLRMLRHRGLVSLSFSPVNGTEARMNMKCGLYLRNIFQIVCSSPFGRQSRVGMMPFTGLLSLYHIHLRTSTGIKIMSSAFNTCANPDPCQALATLRCLRSMQ